ncbi:type II toxin-antitoxin system VapC family toxin [Methanobrevibacter sp.]|uniref:type II toxin-antitoxin system VapC family toxin n=1 Tax=Methanobrevibacter sp. TaxID=66852 RepID=UPI0025DF52F8|nr:type II toxin-antitoxin system VapC family toxin [Methanobrevibacter sp.]MBQ6511877.1 type II toxin-antitoxin system VapC family toxin [Methanobrevibacter sp.]
MYFLDTTFVVALFVSNDYWHPQALEVYKNIKNHELVISSLVIAETITVLKNKLETKEILEIYRSIPNFFQVIEDTNCYGDAMSEFVKYDSTLSFFDAMYVAIMKKYGINEIISFDSDFDKVDNIIRIH